MLSLDEALARLLAPLKPVAETESLPTFEALGRVLAEDLRSPLDVPPLANSSMDGYAVRAAEVADEGVVMPVSQRIAAGQVGEPLEPGSAARIFTGAALPPGADAIVMQEQAEVLDDGRVRLQIVPTPRQWVREQGEDVRRGSTVLARGSRLTPQALGLAATVGAARLPVVRRLRVALLSTGDELAMPGEPLRPGAIYNSNRYTLRALLAQAGCECTDLGIVPDSLEATRQALRGAAGGHDLILSSGGVSVGEEDHVKAAVQAEGRLDLWQVAIKPGKPLAFGHVDGGPGRTPAWFLGLPGNPVASFVTFLLAVRPVLAALQGAVVQAPAPVMLPAGFDWLKPDRRREFLRVRRGADGRLELFPNQSSGVLSSTVWADGLVDNPPGQAIRAGDLVRYVSLREWLA
ncbi:molybdopterin molybdotransferase MoeA [Aquabacterium sp. A7-Y]|uniref:molybdopterin molybdotransferase MoeA n=1 Tax=Aquabacterium sp. A7-Y TaxID=1349605 RepID=UPI00223E2B96|nr:gephyrin-like molybdotransferase Glp [Aquabacterium sp. A7-Y]MCW7541322.1 molybdopterin molybdotransferase MoeA [Aquabacterium sp. A7-Y]